MNKQELIEKYKSLEGVWNANGAEIARQCFLRDLEQLNEIDTNTFRYRDVVDRLKELAKIDRVSWIAKIMEDFSQECDMISKKVTIPQFVADWIEVCKEHLTNSLYLAMTPSFLKANNQSIELILWIKKKENQETFAFAWINGYEVMKEKRYTVKMRTTKQPLFYNSLEKRLFFSLGGLATQFTRKELEDVGFGEVFGNPLFEVEEVEG